jgi:hypothetical protein
MVVGVGTVDIFIAHSRSLKEKRSVLRRILERTRNKFNVSIAETGRQDNWKRSEIGFSVVGNDKAFINSKLDKIVGFIEGLNAADITSSKIEIMGINDNMNHPYGEGIFHEKG